MTLSEAANLADLLTAVGVIVSLGFVAYELREGNRQARTANVRAQLEALQRFRSRISDAGVAAIVLRGRDDYASLSREDQLVFSNYLLEGIYSAMVIYVHRGQGRISTEEAEAVTGRHLRDLLDYPGTRTWWANGRDASVITSIGRRQVDKALAIAAERSGGAPTGRSDPTAS